MLWALNQQHSNSPKPQGSNKAAESITQGTSVPHSTNNWNFSIWFHLPKTPRFPGAPSIKCVLFSAMHSPARAGAWQHHWISHWTHGAWLQHLCSEWGVTLCFLSPNATPIFPIFLIFLQLTSCSCHSDQLKCRHREVSTVFLMWCTCPLFPLSPTLPARPSSPCVSRVLVAYILSWSHPFWNCLVYIPTLSCWTSHS